jgi:hypothetical protein
MLNSCDEIDSLEMLSMLFHAMTLRLLGPSIQRPLESKDAGLRVLARRAISGIGKEERADAHKPAHYDSHVVPEDEPQAQTRHRNRHCDEKPI